MVLSFPNLVAPTCTRFPSLTAAVDAGKAAANPSNAAMRALDKDARRNALKQANTVWPCLTTSEGVNPALRVSAENPPVLLHGFIADYDNLGKRFTVGELVDIARRCAYPPSAGGASLSGDGAHAIWLFKEPIPVLGNAEYARKVCAEIHKNLRVNNFLQGFDAAFLKPDRLLSIDPDAFGFLTERGEGQVVDEVSTRLWASNVTASFEFEGAKLDLAKVYEQIQKLYPGRWVGDFTVGSRGCRFWDSGASDSTAAVVTSTGMVYFTNGGGFKPWSSILGNDVASKLTADSLSQLTNDWYYDSTNCNYIVYQPHNDTYAPKIRTQLQDRLDLYGLEDERERKRAIVYIEDYKGVTSVVALANQKRGLIKQGALTYLNTTQTVPVVPAPGDSPFIQTVLRAMFGPTQIEYFLAWLQDSVKCALECQPSFAQVLFLSGEAECGKSLLQYRVITPLLGGKHADPMPYMLGSCDFNSELGDAGSWIVSDAEGARNGDQRASFTQRIKAASANPAMSVRPKFKIPVTLYTNARLTFSFNFVAECLSVIPRLGSDVLGKLCLFKIHQHKCFEGLGNRKVEQLIASELPHFAYWLLHEYKPDPKVMSPGRYPTVSYHSPELLSFARASQDSSELLGWLNIIFTQNENMREHFAAKKAVEHTAAQWLQIIAATCGHHFSLSPNKLSAHMSHLARQFPDAIKSRLDPKSKVLLFSVDYNILSIEAK